MPDALSRRAFLGALGAALAPSPVAAQADRLEEARLERRGEEIKRRFVELFGA